MTVKQLILVALSALTSACVDGTIISVGQQGGTRNNPGACAFGPTNQQDPWVQAAIAPEITAPQRCPFIVAHSGTFIDLAVNLRVPKNTSSSNGSAEFQGMWSMHDGHSLAGWQNSYYEDHPTLSDFRRAQFSRTYLAAWLGNQNQFWPWAHDSGSVTATTSFGPARAQLLLSGGAENLGAAVHLVSLNVGAGIGGSVRAVTDADTNSYSYSWSVNGQTVATNSAVIPLSFQYPGSYPITANAQYWDGVREISGTLNVPLVVNMSGPSSISPNELHVWSASVPGGYLPISHQWYVDGAPAGNGSSLETSFSPESLHDIVVEVTDAQNYSAWTSMIVTVNTGTCEPEDPNCAEMGRAPLPKKDSVWKPLASAGSKDLRPSLRQR